MSKIDDKKKAVAGKMKGSPNKAVLRRELANGKKVSKHIIEGDMDGTDVYENKFSKADTRKEVRARKIKHGKEPAHSLEI